MLNRQITQYFSIGVASALLDIAIMQGLIFWGVNYLLATFLGFIFSLFFNFFLHSKVTFRQSYSAKSFFRYIFVVIFNICLTLVIVGFFENYFKSAFLGKVFSLIIVFFVGFCLGKFWVFSGENIERSRAE